MGGRRRPWRGALHQHGAASDHLCCPLTLVCAQLAKAACGCGACGVCGAARPPPPASTPGPRSVQSNSQAPRHSSDLSLPCTPPTLHLAEQHHHHPDSLAPAGRVTRLPCHSPPIMPCGRPPRAGRLLPACLPCPSMLHHYSSTVGSYRLLVLGIPFTGMPDGYSTVLVLGIPATYLYKRTTCVRNTCTAAAVLYSRAIICFSELSLNFS